MRTAKCQNCNSEKPLGSLFHVNQQLYCEPCANQVIGQLRQQKAPLQVTRGIDPSVCVKCCADAGSGEFPKAGKLPLCPTCHERAYNYDFPAWLKAGLAFTLVLLVVDLVHGERYFRAGRQFYRAEHLIANRKYADAVAPLRATIAVAPECPKCRLLLAKADLLNGDPNDAYEVIKDRKFEKSALFEEVKTHFNRVDRAQGLYKEAGEQYKQKNSDAALAKIQEAEKIYPEWRELALAERGIRIGQAFDRKDYDGFLQISEADWNKNQDYDAAASFASALACKYATTGQGEFRQRAEDMFAKAQALAKTPADRESLQEFSERLQYRLTTRDIIDKEEYARRFRQKTQPPKSK